MISRNSTGMTIVELTVVVLVLSILVSTVTFSYNSWQEKTAKNAVKSDVQQASSQARSERNFANDSNFPATSNFSFKSSPKVSISYSQTASGKNFCIVGTSSVVPSVIYHMSASDKEPSVGSSC